MFNYRSVCPQGKEKGEKKRKGQRSKGTGAQRIRQKGKIKAEYRTQNTEYGNLQKKPCFSVFRWGKFYAKSPF